MKLTCLSTGGGAHRFPPCHMLELCGFRLLLECPLDLSALTIFSPLDTYHIPSAEDDEDKDADDPFIIKAVPWYKTINNLHLWDPSLIDAVLLSTPAGMLGLPFLTRTDKFSGEIFATEATAKIGRMMMEELVSMHDEFVQFYSQEEAGSMMPGWMKWEELEKMPSRLRDIVAGRDCEELGSWMPLYSAADIKKCMQSVRALKYAEEACFNGAILLKAFSSGLEIGSCNWTINGPRRSVAYLSSSIVRSMHAMDFDYSSLRGNDVVLFSDRSSLGSIDDVRMIEDDLVPSHMSQIRVSCDNEAAPKGCLINSNDGLEEMEKINFICSCVTDSLNEGGSVLIPIGQLGPVLVLIEQISQSLESSNMKVPIFMISPIAGEMLAFTNAVPEWLCKARQEKLFCGEALFGHVELMREKKLHLFPQLHSSELLMMWKEPCIVFSPHWSLRLGPVVHLLRRWHSDSKCLLILEEGVDAEDALLPFKTLDMKVLQCSFLSGLKPVSIQPLLEVLQPKLVLFPEEKRFTKEDDKPDLSFLYYSQNATVRVPKFRDNFEAYLAADLAVQLRPRKLALKEKVVALARLNVGRLLLSNGKYRLVHSGEKPVPNKPARLYWGHCDPARVLSALQHKGINGSIVLPSGDEGAFHADADSIICTIHIDAHGDDVAIRMSATETVICCADETMAARIYEAVSSVCDGI